MLTFVKPIAHVWDKMPLYQKIRYYGRHLTREYAPYVDKLEAKKHALRLCPEIAIPRVLKIFRNNQSIEPSDLLPRTFFKASHGSGWNVRITPRVSASVLNRKRILWNRVYSHDERQYTFLIPRFFLEEEIDCFFGGDVVVDIKVMCIYGQPIFILVERGSTSFYLDITWTHVVQAHNSVTHARLKKPSPPPRPPDLDRLLLYARMLSKPFECVRIDLYVGQDNNIYFSEFTFTHAAGSQRLDMCLEKKFGSFWTHVPQKMKNNLVHVHP